MGCGILPNNEYYIKCRPKKSKEEFKIIGKLKSKALADGYVVGLQKREIDKNLPQNEYIVVRKGD